MKRSIIYSVAIFLLFITCKKEPETIIVQDTRGYKCENNTCTLVESGGQYLTLAECKSECADNRPGSIQIEITCPIYSYKQQVDVGIAYSSEEIAQNLYISSKHWTEISGATERIVLKFTKDSLSPGRYYSKVERNSAGINPDKRSNVFDIKPNQTTSISIVY